MGGTWRNWDAEWVGPNGAGKLSGWNALELGFRVGVAWQNWDAEWVGLCGRAEFLAFTSSSRKYLLLMTVTCMCVHVYMCVSRTWPQGARVPKDSPLLPCSSEHAPSSVCVDRHAAQGSTDLEP